MPLRPIVSSIGAVSYERSKELPRIRKPLVGKSPYQVQNTKDFIQQIQGIHLQPDQHIMSYDVKVLFTSVPIQPAINIITKLLEDQGELQHRTSMSVSHITRLLEFYLKGTYFTFQGRYYEQQEGAAMGSSISPIVANLYMEDFEKKAINSSPHPLVSGEDLFMIPLPSLSHHTKKSFLDHINSVDKHIQFTIENSRPDGSMPFLDILITPSKDGSLHTTVYRKPTHIDLYLQCDSHHIVSSKYSMIGTLHHRAQTVCSSPQLLQQEGQYLQKHSKM